MIKKVQAAERDFKIGVDARKAMDVSRLKSMEAKHLKPGYVIVAVGSTDKVGSNKKTDGWYGSLLVDEVYTSSGGTIVKIEGYGKNAKSNQNFREIKVSANEKLWVAYSNTVRKGTLDNL